jgi:hypothetical protein
MLARQEFCHWSLFLWVGKGEAVLGIRPRALCMIDWIICHMGQLNLQP